MLHMMIYELFNSHNPEINKSCTLRNFRIILETKFNISLSKKQRKFMKQVLTEFMNQQSNDENCFIQNTTNILSGLKEKKTNNQLNTSPILTSTPSILKSCVEDKHIIEIKATQLEDHHEDCPLLPPDLMYVNRQLESYECIVSARQTYKILAGGEDWESKRSRRKYLKRSKYISLFEYSNLIILNWNTLGDFNVEVQLGNNELTYIKVRQAPEGLTSGIKNLHKRLSMERLGNSRNSSGDGGKMFSLGIFKNETEFKITEKNEDVQQMVSNIAKKRKEWVQLEFKNEFEIDYDGKIDLPYLNESISDFMVHSISLANSSHYDINDGSITTSTWIEESAGNTTNWFLLFPNVTCHKNGIRDTESVNKSNGFSADTNNRATAIQLFDGCTVNWDASKLRHSSSQVTYKSRNKGTSGGNCQVRKRRSTVNKK